MTDAHPDAQALLVACRELMRCILTLSRREADRESLAVRVRAARGFVEEAVNTLYDNADDPDAARMSSLSRIAATLTTQLVQDLLLDEERKEARDVDRQVDPGHDRDGFRGYTWAISIPDLMGFLQLQQKSGILRVNTGAEVISLIFDRGDLIHSSSDNSPPGFRLGEILVNHRAIGLKALEQCLLRNASNPQRLGKAMEDEGLITQEQLRIALDVQLQGIFHRLFAARDAYFTFREGHTEGEIEERRNVFQLLLETCRVSDEASS